MLTHDSDCTEKFRLEGPAQLDTQSGTGKHKATGPTWGVKLQGHGYTPGSLARALLHLCANPQPKHPFDGETHIGIADAGLDSGRVDINAIAGQPVERRHFPRRQSQSAVSVRCPAGPRTGNSQQTEWLLHSSRLKGQIVDVGMQGVAFYLSEPIEIGSTITLRLSNSRLDTSFDVLARVMRVSSDGPEGWKIVCRFVKQLSLEQVHALGRHCFASPTV